MRVSGVLHPSELEIPRAGESGFLVDPERAPAKSLFVNQRPQARFLEEVARRGRIDASLPLMLRHGDEQERHGLTRGSDACLLSWLQVDAGSATSLTGHCAASACMSQRRFALEQV